MAGMGFDAAMMEATSDALTRRLGWPAYVLGGLRRLRDRPMRLRIRLDDGPEIVRRARTVLIANVGKLQGGIELLPEAKPDDGTFDIAVIGPRHLSDWLALAWAVLRKRPHPPRMETFRAGTVDIHSHTVQPRQADGDVIAPSRGLSTRIRPAALLLCVPG
jgi:diacylglycerol kinase family enzyme